MKYCLVDYSCPDRSGDWLEANFANAIRSGRCVVERVENETIFNKCVAHNAGARRAIREGADYLCFLDADTIVEQGFFDWVFAHLDAKSFLIAGLRPDGFDAPSLTGLLVVSAKEFAQTEGFDESFKGWGSEDIEMRLRLHVRHALAFGDVPLSLVRPLPHEDDLRSLHYQEKDIHRSDQRNFSRMIHKLNGWRRDHAFDAGTAGRLFYRPMPSYEGSSAAGSSSSPPAPLDAGPLGGTAAAIDSFEGRFCVRGAKGAVVFDDLELPSEKAQRARLYAPCFGQEAIERIDPPLHPERVPNPAPYFEHDALISVCTQRHEEWSRVAFVGIGRQTRGAETEPDWSVLGRHVAATGGGHDAYGIGIDDYHPTVWRSLGRMETRAWDIARHLLVRRLGVPEAVLSRRAVLIQGNRWIARPRAFERYVREWLIPARTALEDRDDRALQALLAPPTRGGRFPIPPEPWKRLDPDGRVHESYHPYVLERLAPLFFVFAGYRLHLIRHA